MMRDPYDPYGGQPADTEAPVTAQDLDDRTPEQQRADAIAACEICDEHGYRAGSIVCVHFNFAPASARGKAACLEALKKTDRGSGQ